MLKSCPWTLLVLLAALLVGCAKSTKTTADSTEADPDTTVAMDDGQDEAVEVAAEVVAADVVATEEVVENAADATAAAAETVATAEDVSPEESGPSLGNLEGTEVAAPAVVTETVAATVSATAPEKPHQVVLGTADLYRGIPGDRTLSVAQIEQWLANPENHEILEVELPKGLDLGRNQIQGIDETPLTRAKIELGRQLYFDTRLSADGTVSCASCHDPEMGYAKDTQFGVGINGQQGGRNSPVAYNRIVSGKQFWDGRAGSLEEQAVGPIANPIEMGHTHEGCVKSLSDIEGYRIQFEKIFPDGVTIDNVGKAIASFERAIVTGTGTLRLLGRTS